MVDLHVWKQSNTESAVGQQLLQNFRPIAKTKPQ